ncbi:PREDICTED: RNA/RNP complex-1-interacting phosphatase [Gavialis gangeticus]|uniref:RNA/RNP complex-1-interacting phosphatase n=1 Tax=Gavialis gangeticus TaxID=94835 RepID=UPI00092EC518|nr:PREDICTED: RNA/RNP complex-1-interacting phosphatase [Gavialis gangeticus]
MPGANTRLPDRWTDYVPLGRRLPGTRFIAFKVPLKKSFEWRLAPEERFSPTDLVKQIKEQKEELGMIIDLTYTTRYYGPEELPDTLCYYKIFTVGHEVPDNETIFKFKGAVKKFLRENKDNDKLIGVHCTHGLNRTGYLVCRYLIDVEGMDPAAAIELFNGARGHHIERTNYIEDLQNGPMRLNNGIDSSRFDLIQGKVRTTPSIGTLVAGHKPHHSKQLTLVTPLAPHPVMTYKTCYDSRSSDYYQDYIPPDNLAWQTSPCNLGSVNYPIPITYNKHKGSCYPVQSYSQQLRQEKLKSKKSRRRNRKRNTK